jgi:hypothetical protein
LADALALAFPCGGMTVAGLRREAGRGRLDLVRIAGKDFVTLAAITEMIERCRVPASPRASGSAPKSATPPAASSAAPSGTSSTQDAALALASALTMVERLKQRSPRTSSRRAGPSAAGATLHRFPSPT